MSSVLDDIDTVLTTLDPFEIAWATAPADAKRYTEMEHAEYFYRLGMRDGRMAELNESNTNLKLMMAAREIW